MNRRVRPAMGVGFVAVLACDEIISVSLAANGETE